MTALVIVEAFAIVLLGLLVAGLLRSHAEILKLLHDAGVHLPGEDDHGGRPFEVTDSVAAPRHRDATVSAHDIAGDSVDGDAIGIRVVGSTAPTLLAFLSSGCATCAGFWEAFANGARTQMGNVRLVIITKDSGHESRAALQTLAPADVPVVMSSDAWKDYEVPGSPYFVMVTDRIVGEGSAGDWAQLSNLISQAIADGEEPGPHRHIPESDRAERIDAELAAAGILPGDESLYPGEDEASPR